MKTPIIVMLFPKLCIEPEYIPLQTMIEHVGYSVIEVFLKENNYILDEC